MDEGADDGFERVPYQQNTSAIEILGCDVQWNSIIGQTDCKTDNYLPVHCSHRQ